MRLINPYPILLLALSLILLCLQSVQGNTEKLIFSASSSDKQEQECIHDRHDETGYVLKPPYSTIQRALIPRTPNTTITPSLSQHWYTLDNLQTDMNYGVRISYPATSPTDFYLTLYRNCNNDNKRHLLVQGDYAGVSNIPGIESSPVTYDIVLENLYLGFLFYQVYKISAAIAIVLLLGQFVILPKIRQIIQESIDSKNNKD